MIGVAEEAAVRERAIHGHIEGFDLVLSAGLAAGNLVQRERSVGHIEYAAVGRESQAVRLLEIRHPAQGGVPWVEAVDAAMVQLRLHQAALVRHEQAEGRVGEPDRAVPRDCHVVGRIEPLALEMGDDRRRVPVSVRAAYAAPPVLAMHQLAVRLERVAVDKIRAVDRNRDMAVRVPGQQAAVRHVGPEQTVARRLPDRAFCVQRALIQTEQLGVRRQDVG